MSVEIIENVQTNTIGTIQKQIEQHALKVEKLISYAMDYQVVSNWSAEEAISIAGEAKSLYKRIEDTRKEITEPYRKFINKVNDTAKVFTEKLKSVEEIIKSKVDAWKRVQEQKNKEEEEAAKALAESAGLDVLPFVEKTPKHVRGDGAMSYEMTQWKFDIEDVNLIPREYLMVDEVKVKTLIKAGIREIPGLKIYSEQKTVIKSR